MRIAKIVGNVVSTIKEETHHGHKMMIIDYFDIHLNSLGEQAIALDAVGAGIGDIVLTCKEGGAAKKLFDRNELISDITICGIVDHYSIGGKTVKIH